MVVTVWDLDPQLGAGGRAVKFVEVDFVRVYWLLVSNSGCDEFEFALLPKVMQDKLTRRGLLFGKQGKNKKKEEERERDRI